MLAAVLTPDGSVRTTDVRVPRTPPGGALLRVTAVGICGSDLHKFGHLPAGTILGHEVAGVIERTGANTPRFREGDRIVSAHHVPCGSCFYCREGNESQCALFRSTNLVPGGWAEYVALSSRHLRHVAFPIPDSLDAGVASLTEPLACCIRAIRRSGVRKNETCTVVGLGPVGLMIAALLKRRGAKVLALDRIGERTRFAARWAGAIPLPIEENRAVRSIHKRTGERGADHVFLTAGSASSFAIALDSVRRGGAIHLFSSPDEGVLINVDLNSIYKREVRIAATYSASPASLAESFRLVRREAVSFSRLITHHLPLTRIAEGIRLIRKGKALKVILEPSGGETYEK